MKNTRKALFMSAISLLLCVSMLIGTTFAWFTDSVSSSKNIIAAGNLDVELEYLGADSLWHPVNESTNVFAEGTLWEPGHTEVVYLRVSNLGSLALKYKLGVNIASEVGSVNVNGDPFKLSDYIHFGAVNDVTSAYASREAARAAVTSSQLISKGFTKENALKAGDPADYVALVVYMPESVGNEANYAKGEQVPLIDLGISLVATQYNSESDSFGKDYDKDATFPDLKLPVGITVPVETDANNKVTKEVRIMSSSVSIYATVPVGVQLNPGTTHLTLSVTDMEDSKANITLGENEISRSLDVHIEGIADDNTVPAIVTIPEAMMTGLNMGNYKLYHVESGASVQMTYVATDADLDAHNEFTYDPATGDVTLAMATFSEVAVVADTENAWEGNFDYSWYTNAVAPLAGEAVTEYTIANADQLAAFGAIVGGMNGQTQDSFAGKAVKLIADVNLGDAESENNPNLIFYPIGYYNSEGTYERTNTAITSGLRNFEGTFDGNGHTIANFYQNTWEMKGDNNYYDATLQYYRDGMGLFGKVYGGTVKNLTVNNFSSDGEYTTTGVIAAYADFGATFENIAITNCNPRVYNIGNGGIVGCVGWYTAGETDKKVTFTNITVDNTNKISALWGSWDVACGGLVGQYYPTSGQTSANNPVNAGIDFVNCHVSAQIDVYNDVCANYQYYAYRYSGMMIGSIRENETIDGHVYPKMDGITASGCTVHFGDWNDYYYCELVANSLASYTHDHQMSRLEQVASVDVNNKKVTTLKGETIDIPASGRVNYVVVKAKDANGAWIHGDGADYATCYHFVNGVQHKHDVADTDNPEIYENVNGVQTLKEDKQLVYREFNQLFTGYGWGVTSKGLTDYEGVENMDITAGNHESSVEKFEGKVDALTTNREYTIDEIFAYIDDCGVKVVDGALNVTITNLDENGNVKATFIRGSSWNVGTISFENTGNIAITIQDYYFCKPTTIEVTVTERESDEKFATKFTGDFLYRVGNQNTVSLGSLFDVVKDENGNAKYNINDFGVYVTIDKVYENSNVSGAFTANTTDWTKGTIQFSDTGVVMVTITDNNYCEPTVLELEVVDAVNTTTAISAKSNNVVLLNDVNFSTIEVSNGYTLYGNGFKMTATNDVMYDALGVGFVTLKNGTLDNVQIICPNFSYAIIYSNQIKDAANTAKPSDGSNDARGNVRSAVIVDGNSKIINSYIHGGRAAIFLRSGNLVVDNSTISGGAAANIHAVSAQSLTLRDATLIQKPFQATVHDTSKTLMGFSVLFECDENGNTTPLTLEGTLIQDAWVNETYSKYAPDNAQSIINSALKQKDYLHDLDNDGTNESLNLGFAYVRLEGGSIEQPQVDDKRDDNTPYGSATVSISIGNNAVVYSYKNTNGTRKDFIDVGDYVPTKQGPTSPKVNFTDVNTDRVFETKFDTSENRWESTLTVNLDNGNYTFNFNKLLVQKHGSNLTYTVKTADGSEVDINKAITLTASGVTEYVLTVTDGDATHTVYFILTATKKVIPAPVKTADPNGTHYLVVKSKGSDWSCAINALDGAKIEYYDKNGQKQTLDLSSLVTTSDKGKLNGTSNTWTKTQDGYTLKITCGYIHDTKQIYGMPVAVNGRLYFTISSTNGYVSTSTSGRTVKLTYEFTDPNGKTLTFSNTTQFNYADYKNGKQYSYSDFVNGTLKEASGVCITGDTLITLADGTQKRIEDMTGNEMLLVWNHTMGTLESIPAVNLVKHSNVPEEYEIIHLYFSDGRDIKVIGEHVFFDNTLNLYVTLDKNASEYIGHDFAMLNGNKLGTAKLIRVEQEIETTIAYEINSYQHLTCFTNEILSASAYADKLLNIFDIDPNTMAYNEEKIKEDIQNYGLYTYADFAEFIDEETFELYNAKYLKIAVGKGYITWNDILNLIDIFLSVEEDIL